MTIAHTLGRFAGYTAAVAGHAVCATATATGDFGKDLAEGAVTGYVDHAARLAELRAARPARIAIAVVPAPARAKARA